MKDVLIIQTKENVDENKFAEITKYINDGFEKGLLILNQDVEVMAMYSDEFEIEIE